MKKLNETGYCGCGNPLQYGKYCNECMGIDEDTEYDEYYDDDFEYASIN